MQSSAASLTNKESEIYSTLRVLKEQQLDLEQANKKITDRHLQVAVAHREFLSKQASHNLAQVKVSAVTII
jgi:hypothetical protein